MLARSRLTSNCVNALHRSMLVTGSRSRAGAGVLARTPLLRNTLPTFHAETPAASITEGYTAFGHDDSKARSTTALQFCLPNVPGKLIEFLEILKRESININQLSSREGQDNDLDSYITIYCDLSAHADDANFKRALADMRAISPYVAVISTSKIPWYPRSIHDLNDFDLTTLAAGGDLQCDHPGFHDAEYRARRAIIAEIAHTTKIGDPIPRVEYSASEHATWGAVFRHLTSLYPTHACKEYNYVFPLMVENCGFVPDKIPQLEDVNAFLMRRTGWRLRPVTGLLGPRDFLNGLGFRVFHSTQYIRHPSSPLYTPEPDICHELLGHVPMLADPHFAAFSHQLGLASLGASDDDIKRLAALYWFTIEFGLVNEHGGPKGYGAGVLSSPGELEWALRSTFDPKNAEKPILMPLDCNVAAGTDYVSRITKYQPEYFVAESFPTMVNAMKDFATSLSRPFQLRFNPYSLSVSTLSVNTERAMRGLPMDTVII